MTDYYVYLVKSQNRLTISNKKILNQDYIKLLDNNGGEEQIRLAFCKLFCLGYLYGNMNKETRLVNDPIEFQ
ncbi:hypothetical protein [Tenacibaculum finnmarkense]|uniref:hypothetical protein n=1 Tax=Tenacibaculum finnmarkense TaxID=2781243 RepID=UPI00187BAB24|nr:hypothetical protein [Tenacibaculum finnmarkense]MBE7649160.1 hypothetical protein [Tenacibaculum finnmarkense genomovar ulcerans]